MDPRRTIPSVNELLQADALAAAIALRGHGPVVAAVRKVLEEHRALLAAGNTVPAPDDWVAAVLAVLDRERSPLRPAINATGVLLHTGLGRAPLADEAIAAMAAVARGYASVELDLASGNRSRRTAAVEPLLCELTGAEAALAVNNNAGATMLALASLAAGREVIVSRGQLVEIGGSYRLPDVMAASGAILREVGTTNKTRLDDYDRAIGERTAALLLVHPSNYAIAGFTQSVALPDLVALGRRRGVPVIHDIGSGAMLDFTRFGLTDEPIAADSIAAGADVVLFSGDKLLGGPQCGILLGRREPLAQIERHPMTRALRVGKLTLAALRATLELYRDRELALRRIPLLQLLAASEDSLRRRAERIAAELNAPGPSIAEAAPGTAFVGGGSVPTQEIGAWCVAIRPARLSCDELAAWLRDGDPAVVPRIKDGRVLLDLRSVFPEQDDSLRRAVAEVALRGAGVGL